ncbi:MAG: hypothetical protein K0R05_2516 [Anaerocolumna sp.]|nr:hypothetical protein [Anaerocolumna sp.]
MVCIFLVSITNFTDIYIKLKDSLCTNQQKKVNIIIKAERNTEKRIQKGNYGNKYNNNLLCMTTLRKYGILSNSCSYE